MSDILTPEDIDNAQVEWLTIFPSVGGYTHLLQRVDPLRSVLAVFVTNGRRSEFLLSRVVLERDR